MSVPLIYYYYIYIPLVSIAWLGITIYVRDAVKPDSWLMGCDKTSRQTKFFISKILIEMMLYHEEVSHNIIIFLHTRSFTVTQYNYTLCKGSCTRLCNLLRLLIKMHTKSSLAVWSA